MNLLFNALAIVNDFVILEGSCFVLQKYGAQGCTNVGIILCGGNIDVDNIAKIFNP